MKKTLTLMALLGGVASVYSQGQIAMSDYGSSFTIQIFNQQSLASSTVAVNFGGYTGNEEMGTSANGDLNAPGTTVFAAGSALGTGYDVELLGGPAGISSTGWSSLIEEGGVITTWYTAAGGNPLTGLSGFYKSTENASVSSVAGGGVASVALAAWANTGGLGAANTLAQAQLDGYAWGVSLVGQTADLGGGIITPPNLPSSITSFSLSVVPEPSTIALGVIGASALLMRLRRK